MTTSVTVTVNGRTHSDDVQARLLLVHYLREVLGLTGTHVGCETSLCGACTVMVDGKAVKSCTMLAAQADGAEITTIEGLADGITSGDGGPAGDGGAPNPEDADLHPLQTAFWEEHGLQCGFCTPGMIMAAVQLLEENPDPDEDEIREGLEGNLCRCTGYHNIVHAVRRAAGDMGG